MTGPHHFISLTSRVTFLVALFFSGVAAQTSDNPKCRNPVDNCDAATNYFPPDQRVEIKYAKKTLPEFTYSNTYVDVSVNYTASGLPEPAKKYRFIKCGCTADADDRTTVYIDPEAIYVDDSVIIAMIDTLDPQLTPLKYVKNVDFKYNEDLRNKVKNGEIQTIDPASIPDLPDVSATLDNPFGLSGAPHNLSTPQTPGIIVAELREASPLARAEWLKFIGMYLDKPKEANDLFVKIEQDYTNIVSRAKAASRRPSVFLNFVRASFDPDAPTTYPGKYVWSQPGGNTYMAQYMEDANADYRSQDDGKETSPTLSLDEIRGNFTSTHFLVNAGWFPGISGGTMKDVLAAGQPEASKDEQLETYLRSFTAIRCGNVVSQTKRITDNGLANDFFEMAVVRPDLLLADYVKVLHPDVDLAGHVLTFMYTYGRDDSLGLECPFANLVGDTPNQGKVYVDQTMEISGASRFKVQDELEPKVFPQLRQRGVNLARTDFQFPDPGKVKNTSTRVLVRQEVDASQEEETEKSSRVVEAFRIGLGSGVEVSTDDDDSLSAAVIVAIVFAVIVAVVVLALFVFLIIRRRRIPKQFDDIGPTEEFPVVP